MKPIFDSVVLIFVFMLALFLALSPTLSLAGTNDPSCACTNPFPEREACEKNTQSNCRQCDSGGMAMWCNSGAPHSYYPPLAKYGLIAAGLIVVALVVRRVRRPSEALETEE